MSETTAHTMNSALAAALKLGASDIHFTAGEDLALRVLGDIVFVSGAAWTFAEVAAALAALMGIKSGPANVEEARKGLCKKPLAASRTVKVGEQTVRVRIHAKAMNGGGMGFSLRVLADKPVSLAALQTPRPIVDIALRRKPGLILITGETGSGKSTTLAALMQELIETAPVKIVTYEAPVEVVFRSETALVQQHEVGGTGDIESYIAAAHSALREDPDVVMFGELREPEEIRLAVEVAETGHLVFATLHTGTALESISRIISAAPDNARAFFQHKVAATLLGVLCQRLITSRGGKLRANYEVMTMSEAIAARIRSGDFSQLKSAMFTGRKDGMFTYDDHLAALVRQGDYTVEEALRASPAPMETFAHFKGVGLVQASHIPGLEKILGMTFPK
jgi:twitching motility protein PilT